MPHYLACDLGAESGRVMLGSLADGRLELRELHRFPNNPIRDGDSLRWNTDELWRGIREGLKLAGALGLEIQSVSCDSWGLDCVLLDADGKIMQPVFHYRDPRTAEGVKRVFAKLPWERVFAETGIQFMPINGLYHLAMEPRERLAAAASVVPIGDAFNHLLGGVQRAEVSMASTTQLYNPQTRDWSAPLLAALELTRDQFPDIVPSGTDLAPLRTELAAETGLSPRTRVIAGCTHDTAAAVAAVPAAGSLSDRPDWAYLSSGTWSLMGVERATPLINDDCRELNLTNEIGYGGSIRLLKNIIGLWLVQECRRQWAADGEEFDYATLAELVGTAEPFRSLIDPDDERFLAPDNMPNRIRAFCRETGQPVPESPGQIIRTCLESLALLYRKTLRNIGQLTGADIRRLHVVGGGSQNRWLNQFTADACKIPVHAGPVEATALGNVLVQALAAGDLPSLAAAREVVARSVQPVLFEPSAGEEWDAAAARFEELSAGT